MRIFRRTSGAFHALTLGLIAFHVIAACRGVLPEVCATQRLMEAAVETRAAEAEYCTTPACCSSTARDTGGPGGHPVTPASCAFCAIAKGIVEPLELLRPVLFHTAAPPAPLPAYTPILSRATDPCRAGRAPPTAV